jgi:hypothetical protein
MKILFLSSSLGSSDSGGRYLSLKILETLKKISEHKIVTVNTDKKECKEAKYNFINNRGNLSKLINLFSPLSNGWYFDILIKVINIVKKEKIEIVWLDSSMMGFLCWTIKLRFPNIKTIIFYHNAERLYYKENSRFNKISYIFYVKAIISEYLINKYSDVQVFLTEKDKIQCASNKVKSFVVSPIFEKNLGRIMGGRILFVGSPNHFNIEAIDFIVQKIAPRITKKILIAGVSKEQYGSKYIPHNVEFSGWLADLDQAYNECSLVLAPVFSGSGIKIKVGEAISKGKTVLASPHAAIGYEELIQIEVLVVCTEENDYINAIEKYNHQCTPINIYNSTMEMFSAETFIKKVKLLIESIK